MGNRGSDFQRIERAVLLSGSERLYAEHELGEFKPSYYEKLDSIGTEKIVRMVRRMSSRAQEEGKELVLLCFEDVRVPEDCCHRTLFAEWWKENTGETFEELPDPTPLKEKKAKSGNKKPAEEIAEDDGCK